MNLRMKYEISSIEENLKASNHSGLWHAFIWPQGGLTIAHGSLGRPGVPHFTILDNVITGYPYYKNRRACLCTPSLA